MPPFNEDWRTARPIAPYHKGDGHITDDTLMTLALIDVYAAVGDHLDAYAVADHLVPLLIGERRWIPELETEALLLHRIFLAEKWLVARLHYGHVDPREAGVGNIVNCGAAMYMTPVGIVNAADPDGAYAEAIEIAGAHQSSYGREAAGVFAAAVAAAMSPGATIESVVDVASTRPRRHAYGDRGCAAVAAEHADWRDALTDLRDAVAPFDTVGPHYRQPSLDARRPSRTKSIEELPVALGLAIVAGGDYREAVLGAVNYGRDSDSIATMAGAITGALGGADVVPAEWLDDGDESEQDRPRYPGDDTGRRDDRHLGARRRSGAPATRPRASSAPDDPPDVGTARGSRRPRHRRPTTRRVRRGCGRRGVGRRRRRPQCPRSGATPEPATAELRALARVLLAELDAVAAARRLRRREPDELEAIDVGRPAARRGRRATTVSTDRPGARRAGSGGRPVACSASRSRRSPDTGSGRSPSRPATGRCVATSLPSGSTRRRRSLPWNRASRATSLAENIAGMPEDDDLNFALLALTARRAPRRRVDHRRRRLAWLELLPGKRVFTAERIAYRNLLDGYEPDETAADREPVPRLDRRPDPHRRLWLGMSGRAGEGGGAGLAGRPPEPPPQRSLRRACSSPRATAAAVVASTVDECIDAGLSVIPPQSRYAAAVRRGVELGAGDLDDEAALDALYDDFGHLHWVHVAEQRRRSVAFALTRSGGDFASAITTCVAGGWDTDSNGATVGSICGGLAGASMLPPKWIDPLQNRLATTIAGFDGIGFDELARRTVAATV